MYNFLPEARLPNLKELTFRGDINGSDFSSKLSSYSNLTTLTLVDVSNFEKFLELIGQQLSDLSVAMTVSGVIDFFKIFHLCPNLTELCVFASDDGLVDNYKLKKLVTSKNFRRLEVFQFISLSQTSSAMPAGLLKMVLQAPSIKKLQVINFSLNKKDCDWLSGVDKARFQKLEEIFFKSVKLETLGTMKDLGRMVKWLVCGAPNLKSVQFLWDLYWYPFAYAMWSRDHERAGEFIKLLNSDSDDE